MNFPTRQMCHFDLSRRLRQLEKYGAEVPTLMNSNYMPEYVETKDDGVEVYRHGGRTVNVRPGEVIDSHGNVVNLGALETQAFAIKIDREDNPSVRYKYKDLTIKLPNSQ